MLRILSFLLVSAGLVGACSQGKAPASRTDSGAAAANIQLDAPPIAEVGNLCLFRPRKEPVMSGFADRTGAQWEGEIRVRDLASLEDKLIDPFDKRVATVVTRPRVDIFRMRIDDNCYDATRKVYYACTKVVTADLTGVRGFARAMTVDRARALSIQLCEKKVAQVVGAAIGIQQDNTDLRCHVSEQAFCTLPPAPAPAPPPAAKK
jgi:hypothetical protein